MPALFVGHGSPMNAIEENEFHKGWRAAASRIPRPRAVLCVSAHWETRGTCLTGTGKPQTIHDFYGFAQELFDVRYPAPGDPALAQETASLMKHTQVAMDPERGLDHGCWSVLRAMYPEADVPVVQLSMDTAEPAAFHYALAGELAPLRERGVLVLGSGNIVHNLGMMQYRILKGFDWAVRIDALLKAKIAAADHAALVDYPALDPDMSKAVPTPEHYLPLLYVLALRRPGESAVCFNDKTVMGSISMTCVRVG